MFWSDEVTLEEPVRPAGVLRYPRATVRGITLDGEALEISGEGLLAQALQHECDHLDGKLYISRLDREARGEAMRQIRTSSWF